MGNAKSSKQNLDTKDDEYLSRRATSVRHTTNRINPDSSKGKEQLLSGKINDPTGSATPTILKRTNSLPTKRKPPSYEVATKNSDSKSGGKKSAESNLGRNSMIKPIPIQGFDLVRHHFGQADCDNWNLNELEASVQLLNEKLLDLDRCRLECLQKFSQINQDLSKDYQDYQKNQLLLNNSNKNNSNKNNNRNSSSFAIELRLKIIEKYLHRIENLFNVNGESSFLLNTEQQQKSTKSTYDSTNVQVEDDLDISHLKQLKRTLKQSVNRRRPRLLPSVSLSNSMPSLLQNNAINESRFKPSETTTESLTSTSTSPTTSRSKRQTIKDAYTHLIRSIMPKLYGNRTFEHRNDPNYREFWQSLAKLRDKIANDISTIEEQQLIDAKRIFLQEINGYLFTLNQMVSCTMANCPKCVLQ